MVFIQCGLWKKRYQVRFCNFPFAQISVEGRAQDLVLDRFSVEVPVQDPFAILSVQGVYNRSPQKISVRYLKVRSLFKLSS